MKIHLTSLRHTQKGIGHVVLIVGLIVTLVVAGAGYLVYTKSNASGAYSSLCGNGYKLRHVAVGNGLKLYNYKNASGRGCAIAVNDNWGTPSKMSIKATYGSAVLASDKGTYPHYAGPIRYVHASGIKLTATKNGSAVTYTTKKF